MADQTPKFFRVVFDLSSRKVCKQLQQYKLEGVTGISSSGAILFSWLGVARDAALVMPAGQVIKLNRLVQVRYDDPEQLLDNNMFVARRIFSKLRADVQDILFNLYEYLFTAMARKGLLDSDYVKAYVPYQTLTYTKTVKRTKAINGVKDFIVVTIKAIKELLSDPRYGPYHQPLEQFLKMPASKWKALLKLMAREVKQVFGDEGEWLLLDRTLRIPKSSVLFILLPSGANSLDDLKRLVEEGHADNLTVRFLTMLTRCKLHKYYKTHFIPRDKWDVIQSKYFLFKGKRG